MFALKIAATLTAAGLIVWGYWHEEKLVEFERAAWKAIKRRFRK